MQATAVACAQDVSSSLNLRIISVPCFSEHGQDGVSDIVCLSPFISVARACALAFVGQVKCPTEYNRLSLLNKISNVSSTAERLHISFDHIYLNVKQVNDATVSRKERNECTSDGSLFC